MDIVFSEIGIVVIVATACALAARLFRQPPLIGYIAAGVILGPIGAHFIQNKELFDALRQIGVALLLFLVGLEMDWRKARAQLRTASALGLVQLAVSFAVGYFLATLGGQSAMTGVYLGLALSFASTVIVVKVLSESRDLNSLHGRLSVGILLFQDLMSVLALTVLGALAAGSGLGLGSVLVLVLVKVAAVLVLAWVSAQYLLPPLFARIARSAELLFLCSLAWCFVASLTVAAYGFPLEVGALLAGVSLASLPYTLDIVTRLRPLRDFFVIILFVVLGSSVIAPTPGYVALTASMIVLTVIGKPVFSFLVLTARGYTSHVSFMAALTQGQLSEFSLLLVALGTANGQLSSQAASAITMTAIASIFVSTMALSARYRIYGRLRWLLKHFERARRFHAAAMADEPDMEGHAVIFGYHRMGYHILRRLRDLKHRALVVDFNPDIIKKLQAEGVECMYGDVQDEDLLESLHADKAAMIVSTVPHRDETVFLLREIRRRHAHAVVIVTAHHIDDAIDYYHMGASYVILPHLLGGEHVAQLLTEWKKHELGPFLHRQREEELMLLKTRRHALYYE